MTDKWKCTTFVVECKKETMQWFDRWNPWALRRRIAKQEKDMAWQKSELADLNSRFLMCVKQNAKRGKRIEELESELSVKQKECDLHSERATFNLKENRRILSEINAAIGLLQELANDKPKVQNLAIKCDRCGKPARFDADGGHCHKCGSNLCADCANWDMDADDCEWCEKCRNASIAEHGVLYGNP